jgi:V8-like Glu-specific endopeptidase
MSHVLAKNVLPAAVAAVVIAALVVNTAAVVVVAETVVAIVEIAAAIAADATKSRIRFDFTNAVQLRLNRVFLF